MKASDSMTETDCRYSSAKAPDTSIQASDSSDLITMKSGQVEGTHRRHQHMKCSRCLVDVITRGFTYSSRKEGMKGKYK